VIWLLRHGEADEGSPDSERRLTAKGEGQAKAAGAALERLAEKIDVCVSSPKVRALDTARLACEHLGIEVVEDRRLEGGPFELPDLASDYGENFLLVGHDPDFSMAVHDATGAQVRLKKGALVAVDRGELTALLRPKEVRALADRD
jgi:phosphohistidine phosphatase